MFDGVKLRTRRVNTDIVMVTEINISSPYSAATTEVVMVHTG